jgi:CRISPR/Cas system-associated exonuclease Cas4 (RecB family)
MRPSHASYKARAAASAAARVPVVAKEVDMVAARVEAKAVAKEVDMVAARVEAKAVAKDLMVAREEARAAGVPVVVREEARGAEAMMTADILARVIMVTKVVPFTFPSRIKKRSTCYMASYAVSRESRTGKTYNVLVLNINHSIHKTK